MKKLIYLGTIISIIFMAVSFTIAQPRSGKTAKNFDRFDKLNLTELQKEKFNEIRFDFQEVKIDLEAKLKKNRLAVKKMITSGEIDENGLMNFTEKGSTLQAEQRKLRVQMWLDIREILDKKQKVIWADNFNNFNENGKRFSRKGTGNGNRHLKNNRDGKFGKNREQFNN